MVDSGTSLASLDLPTDAAELRALAAALQSRLAVTEASLTTTAAELATTGAELRAAKASIQLTILEIAKLKAQLAKLRRMQFGQSSERLSRTIDQLELRLEELESKQASKESAAGDAGAPVAEPERNRPRRRPLPEHLPRREVVAPAPAADGCACGGRLSPLGESVTEVLEYVPGRFEVVRHVRPKLACQRCDAISQAPALPIPRGKAGPALLAHVLVAKYADHLPLYRQAEIYARDGVDLDRSTLADWVGQVSWLLQPLVDHIRIHVFAAAKIHTDDTSLPVLAPGTGKTRTGRLWVYARDDRNWQGPGPPAAVYLYSPDRQGQRPREHLAGYSGFLQADGYTGYDQLYEKDRPAGAIVEVACWAHCRRKLHNEWKHTGSRTAKNGLDLIAAIYKAEDQCRGLPLDERTRLRSASRVAVEAFFAWAEAALPGLSANTDLAKAIRYAVSRRKALNPLLR